MKFLNNWYKAGGLKSLNNWLTSAAVFYFLGVKWWAALTLLGVFLVLLATACFEFVIQPYAEEKKRKAHESP